MVSNSEGEVFGAVLHQVEYTLCVLSERPVLFQLREVLEGYCKEGLGGVVEKSDGGVEKEVEVVQGSKGVEGTVQEGVEGMVQETKQVEKEDKKDIQRKRKRDDMEGSVGDTSREGGEDDDNTNRLREEKTPTQEAPSLTKTNLLAPVEVLEQDTEEEKSNEEDPPLSLSPLLYLPPLSSPSSNCLHCEHALLPRTWLPSLPECETHALQLLFSALSIPDIVTLLGHALLERKLCLVSSSYTLLSSAGHALRSLMSPLEWVHVYAPVLPRSMLDLLQCPTPFILGIHASYAFKQDFPYVTDMLVVDLDLGVINVPQDQLLSLPPSSRLPLERELRDLLRTPVHALDLVGGLDTPTRPFPADAVRHAFRGSIMDLLRGVSSYCVKVKHGRDGLHVFHEQAWVKGCPFKAHLVRSQCFSAYLGENAT